MADSVTKAIIRLFDQERFYAEIVLQMDRILSKSIGTAGVCIKDRIQLYVNPEFFDALSEDEQVAILKHECMHILNDHIPRLKELAPDVYASKKRDHADNLIDGAKHKLMNVAADCAINPGIKNIPEGGCTPEKFDLPPGETVEWYAEKLKDNEKLKGLTEYDGHSLWNESEGSRAELKEKLRAAIQKAGEKAKAAGRLSADEQLLIDRFNYKPKDWKKDLNRFSAKALQTKIESSKKKRNRRYGIMYPGSVKHEELHIGVAIDTSGSISDEALNQFMAEIGNIAKYAKVTVVEADSEVKKSYVFDPKKQYKVSGRGGTAYQPAFDYFTNETDVDGVIYLGDMDTFEDVLIKPKYPVMWAIVGDQSPPASWGNKTQVVVTRAK